MTRKRTVGAVPGQKPSLQPQTSARADDTGPPARACEAGYKGTATGPRRKSVTSEPYQKLTDEEASAFAQIRDTRMALMIFRESAIDRLGRQSKRYAYASKNVRRLLGANDSVAFRSWIEAEKKLLENSKTLKLMGKFSKEFWSLFHDLSRATKIKGTRDFLSKLPARWATLIRGLTFSKARETHAKALRLNVRDNYVLPLLEMRAALFHHLVLEIRQSDTKLAENIAGLEPAPDERFLQKVHLGELQKLLKVDLPSEMPRPTWLFWPQSGQDTTGTEPGTVTKTEPGTVTKIEPGTETESETETETETEKLVKEPEPEPEPDTEKLVPPEHSHKRKPQPDSTSGPHSEPAVPRPSAGSGVRPPPPAPVAPPCPPEFPGSTYEFSDITYHVTPVGEALAQLARERTNALTLEHAVAYTAFLTASDNALFHALKGAAQLVSSSHDARDLHAEAPDDFGPYLVMWKEYEDKLVAQARALEALRHHAWKLLHETRSEAARNPAPGFTEATMAGWRAYFPPLDGHFVDGGAAAVQVARRSLASRFLGPYLELAQLLFEALPVEAPLLALNPPDQDTRPNEGVYPYLSPVQSLASELGFTYEHIPLYRSTASDYDLRTNDIRCSPADTEQVLCGLSLPAGQLPYAICRVPQPLMIGDGIQSLRGRALHLP